MLSVRATNLETFLTCPFKYKYAPDPEPNKKAFLFWRALHSLVEMSVQWVYNKTAEELILYPFEDKDRRILLAQTIKFMEHLEERKLKYIASEYSFTHTFEDIIGEPILEGTFDLLFQDEEWKYLIVDIKTASKLREDDHIESVNQKKIYPALMELEWWIKVDRFEYWIMNKILHPKLQEVVYKVPENNTDDVRWFMQDFVDADENLDYPKKYPNFTCFFCPFNSDCWKESLSDNQEEDVE